MNSPRHYRTWVAPRSLLALAAIALLSLLAGACGSTSKDTSTTHPTSADAPAAADSTPTSSHTAPPGGYLKYDGDTDPDEKPNSGPSADDESLVPTFKYGASQADRQAITTLVKNYYTAAAAGEDAKACSLLDSHLAAGLVEGQSKTALGGHKTCAAFVSLLFRQQHAQLAADVPTIVVTAVHVHGNLGVAELGFRTAPEAEILLEREGSAWKLDALLASETP